MLRSLWPKNYAQKKLFTGWKVFSPRDWIEALQLRPTNQKKLFSLWKVYFLKEHHRDVLSKGTRRGETSHMRVNDEVTRCELSEIAQMGQTTPWLRLRPGYTASIRQQGNHGKRCWEEERRKTRTTRGWSDSNEWLEVFFNMFWEVWIFFGYIDLEAAYLVNLKSWWLYDLVVKENMFNVLSNRLYNGLDIF